MKMKKQPQKNITEEKSDEMNSRQINRRRFLAFGTFIGLYGAGYAAWRWLYKQPGDGGLLGGIQTPLRPVLNTNEKIFTSNYKQGNLAKTYPKENALIKPRVNGDIGLDPDFAAAEWKLEVQKADGNNLSVSLDEIKKLAKTEIVFDFKCIEGWSQITYWGGVKFSDFARHYALENEIKMKYAGMSTPDDGYYIGIDMESVLHPQTLLCYEMNGKPLTAEHGYPLRLITPVKYGVKNLKRIGTLYFANERPADYWAERGYDYYGGL
jgi:DMSO/TMAO reductase YedYZ molybdopterin-dependent catalytic subunit